MAWTTIDDGAFTTDSDSPLSAAHCVKVRDNAAYVSEHRPPQTGIAFPKNEPVRLCTFAPMCLGPFWLYLPPGESYSAINVRIRIGGCDYDGESAGTEAAYLHVTTGRAFDPYIERPPALKANWAHAVDKGDTGLLTFEDVPINSDGDQYGWLPVFLWIWSNYSDTAESDGSLHIRNPYMNAFYFSDRLDPAPTKQPPERVIMIDHVISTGNGNPLPPEIYQIAWYTTEGSGSDPLNNYGEIFPVMPPGDYEDAEYEVFPCGVVELQSISIEAVAPAFEPIASAYHSDRPAGEQWLALSQSLNQIVNFRTPQWLCHPGPDSVEDGEHSRIWPIRADAEATGYTGAGGLTGSDWRPLAAAVILEEPVNDNGYQAILSVVFPRFEAIATTADVKIRLSAYTAGTSTLQASGPPKTIGAVEVLIDRMRSLSYAPRALGSDYSPLFHALAGSTIHEGSGSSWQQRGLLGFQDVLNFGSRHDWSHVINVITHRLPHDDIDYTDGVRIVIEAQLSTNDDNQICAVIGAGIRSMC